MLTRRTTLLPAPLRSKDVTPSVRLAFVCCSVGYRFQRYGAYRCTRLSLPAKCGHPKRICSDDLESVWVGTSGGTAAMVMASPPSAGIQTSCAPGSAFMSLLEKPGD